MPEDIPRIHGYKINIQQPNGTPIGEVKGMAWFQGDLIVAATNGVFIVKNNDLVMLDITKQYGIEDVEASKS